MIDTFYPRVSAKIELVDSDKDIRPEVDIICGFSSSRPATLLLTIINERDTVQTVKPGPTPPFSEYWSDSLAGDNAKLVLASVEYHDYAIPENPTGSGCWRPTEPIVRHKVNAVSQLEPATSLSGEYVLLADPNNTPCFPPGTYQFSPTEPTNVTPKLIVSITLEYTL